MIAPTWGNRFLLRLQSTTGGGILVVKRLGGQAGYGDGPLVETTRTQLSAEKFREFEELVAKSGCEKVGERDPKAGLDGDGWSLDVSMSEFHRASVRWCPNAFNPGKRGTEDYVKVFRWAADKAGVAKAITNKGHAVFDR